jgi:predicted membrane protein
MLLFNEIMVSIYLYLLICLTDFMGENDYRDYIGWALLLLVAFTVLVNLVKFLIVCDWLFLIRKLRKKFLKHKKYAAKTENSRKHIKSTILVSDNTTIFGELDNSKVKSGSSIKGKKKLVNQHRNPFAVGSGDNQEFYYHFDEDEEIKQ